MLDLILKLPRTEKFSIGTEYKTSMYQIMEEVIYVSKVPMEERYTHVIKIDVLVQLQRIYLRLMKAIEQLGEIGRINGGLIKFYGKNYKKPI